MPTKKKTVTKKTATKPAPKKKKSSGIRADLIFAANELNRVMHFEANPIPTDTDNETLIDDLKEASGDLTAKDKLTGETVKVLTELGIKVPGAEKKPAVKRTSTKKTTTKPAPKPKPAAKKATAKKIEKKAAPAPAKKKVVKKEAEPKEKYKTCNAFVDALRSKKQTTKFELTEKAAALYKIKTGKTLVKRSATYIFDRYYLTLLIIMGIVEENGDKIKFNS